MKDIKFYNFDGGNYEYSALVIAENISRAMDGYEDFVCEPERGMRPIEISESDALEIFLEANVENCKTNDEKEIKFRTEYEDFKNSNDDCYVLLIDEQLY